MDGSALKHFKLPDDKNVLEETFKAKCMHCSSEIKGSLKVTSNFVTRLRVRKKFCTFFFNYKNIEINKMNNFFLSKQVCLAHPLSLNVSTALTQDLTFVFLSKILY